MESLFKKFVYTGVGLISLTKDKVQKTIDQLVDENKISTAEGKKLVEDFFNNTESKREELESQLKTAVEKVVKNFSLATSKDLTSLEKRIEELEAALSETDKKEHTENV